MSYSCDISIVILEFSFNESKKFFGYFNNKMFELYIENLPYFQFQTLFSAIDSLLLILLATPNTCIDFVVFL